MTDRFPESDLNMKTKNKLGDQMIKTIIELGYRKISWFIGVLTNQIIDLLGADKLRYFPKVPRPAIVNCSVWQMGK